MGKKHTPTPWKIESVDGYGFNIEGYDDLKEDCFEENKKFMEIAVNSHEENIAVMKIALDWIESAKKYEDESKLDFAIDQLQKAIAKDDQNEGK